MKKSVLFVCSALLSTLLIISCDTPVQGENNSSSTIQQKTQDELALETAVANLSIQTTVTNTETNITLPTSMNGCTITWASSNTSIITTGGAVTHQEGTGSDTVTLTATLRKGTYTNTKTFTVTVYQATVELTPAQILDAAANKLTVPSYNTNTYTAQQITLPTSVSVDDKTVTVTWTDSGDEHLSVSGNRATIIRDIGTVTRTLRATLTYAEQTKTKDVAITIACIPQFKETYSLDNAERTLQFDGTVLTDLVVRTADENESPYISGNRYTYTVDYENDTITVAYNASYYVYDGNLKWRNETEEKADMKTATEHFYAPFKTLCNNPTVEEAKTYLHLTTEDEVLNYIGEFEWNEENPGEYFGEGITTLEQARALSTEQKNAAVQRWCDHCVGQWKWDLDHISASYTDTTIGIVDAHMREEINSNNRYIHERFSSTHTYSYCIENKTNDSYTTYENNLWIKGNSVYDTSKPWYEQESYSRWENDDGEFLQLYQTPGGAGGLRVDIPGTDSASGDGSFNSNYTTFTFDSYLEDSIPNEYMTWNISFNETTKSLTISNGTDTQTTLFFVGRDFF